MKRLAAMLAGKGRYLAAMALVFGLDQWTKWLVETNLPLHSSREILSFFHLSNVRNTGIAFGLFASGGDALHTAMLAGLGLAVLAFITVVFLRTPPDQTRLLWALTLVLGGSVGNLLDRVTRGAVTDFLGVYLGSYRWPDFNLADSAIFLGVVVVLLDALLTPAEPTTPPEAA